MSKRLAIWLLVTVTVVPLAIVLAWLVYGAWVFRWQPSMEQAHHALPFNSARWRSRADGDGERWPTRLRMVDDLLARRVLPGKTRSQVVDLLGKPDMTDDRPAPSMIYDLGPERGALSMDNEILVIEFDAAGKVALAHLSAS